LNQSVREKFENAKKMPAITPDPRADAKVKMKIKRPIIFFSFLSHAESQARATSPAIRE